MDVTHTLPPHPKTSGQAPLPCPLTFPHYGEAGVVPKLDLRGNSPTQGKYVAANTCLEARCPWWIMAGESDASPSGCAVTILALAAGGSALQLEAANRMNEQALANKP